MDRAVTKSFEAEYAHHITATRAEAVPARFSNRGQSIRFVQEVQEMFDGVVSKPGGYSDERTHR